MTILAKLSREARERLSSDVVIYVFIALYTVAGLGAMYATGTSNLAAYMPYLSKWIFLFLITFPALTVLFDTVAAVHRFDNRRKLVFSRVFGPKRVVHLVSGMLLGMTLIFFQGTFTSLKNAMFQWNGSFRYDELHATIDNWLHFGHDPWRFVEPLIANDTVLYLMEFNYNRIYFTICFSTLFFIMTSPKANKYRLHYVICFMLSWIVIGNILAGIFLSAGPAYYGLVTGDEMRFAPLLAHLQDGVGNNDSTIRIQSYLWDQHVAGTPKFATGISAFPSVHVALISMNALFAFEVSRRLGWIMVLYATTIFLSSIALGWHYAIDGYVSVVVVAAVYYGLGALLRSKRFIDGGALLQTAPVS